MSAYEGFSKVYDKFMEDAPYDDWINYLKKIWEK